MYLCIYENNNLQDVLIVQKYKVIKVNIIPDGRQLLGPDMEGNKNGSVGKYSNPKVT